jgi:hypothetical protein
MHVLDRRDRISHTPFSMEYLMASNRGVAYIKPGEVKVQSIDFP